MKSRVLGIAVAFFCLHFIIGCVVQGQRVAIVNPQLIDQKEANEKLITKYCDVVVVTNRAGFEGANAICRQIQAGEIKLADMKSSENGRYVIFMFNEKGDAGAWGRNISVVQSKRSVRCLYQKRVDSVWAL